MAQKILKTKKPQMKKKPGNGRQQTTLDGELHRRLKSYADDKGMIFYRVVDDAIIDFLGGTGY